MAPTRRQPEPPASAPLSTTPHLLDLDGALMGDRAANGDCTFNRRADRFDNAYAAHYTAGQLTQVDFPDGRFETYGYDGTSGKLTSVVQHGVGDTVTRSWVLEWNGDKLDRITYPDSTKKRVLLSMRSTLPT